MDEGSIRYCLKDDTGWFEFNAEKPSLEKERCGGVYDMDEEEDAEVFGDVDGGNGEERDEEGDNTNVNSEEGDGVEGGEEDGEGEGRDAEGEGEEDKDAVVEYACILEGSGVLSHREEDDFQPSFTDDNGSKSGKVNKPYSTSIQVWFIAERKSESNSFYELSEPVNSRKLQVLAFCSIGD